jgi:hypothetical protein
MPSHSRQTLGGELSNEFPRFLSRQVEDNAAFKPPPLPRDPLWVQVCRLMSAAPRPNVLVAAALSLAVPAAAAIVIEGGWGQDQALQPPSGFAARDEVADAIQIVEQFESRLGYAPNLASLAQGTDTAGPADSLQNLISGVSNPAEFHFPENVTASAGGPVDEKAWTWAASDPAQIAMSLSDTQTKAEIEDLLQDDLSAGALPAGASVDNETAAMAAIVVSQVTGASITSGDAGVPPKLQTFIVRTRAIDTVASAEGVRKKRVKRAKDAAKDLGKDLAHAKTLEAADQVDRRDDTAIMAHNSGEVKKPGVFAKMFSWLKGSKASQPGDDEASDGRKAGLLRQH